MIINNKKELLKQIDMIFDIRSKSIREIDFICPNFIQLYKLSFLHQADGSYSAKDKIFTHIMQKIFQLLETNAKIIIHTFNEISLDMDLQDIDKQKNTKYLIRHNDRIMLKPINNKNHIVIHSYIHKHNPFINFIQQCKKQNNNKDIKTLNDLFETIDKEKLRDEHFNELKVYILTNIKDIMESELFVKQIQPQLSKTFESSFDELLEHIRTLIEHRDNDIWKIGIKLIFDIALSIPLLFNPYSFSLSIASIGVGIASFSQDYHNIQNREYHRILTPLTNLLATEFGVFVSFANTNLLTCALIVNKKIILDISSSILWLPILHPV